MSKIKNDYGYIIGVIKALESKLFMHSHYDRMIESKTAADAYVILNDTDFAEDLNSFPNVKDYEEVLEKSLLKTKDYISKTIPNDIVLDWVWKWYDFYNVKLLIKASVKNKTFEDVQNMLSVFGSIDKTDLRDFVFGNKEIEIFGEVKQTAIKAYNETQNIKYIDFIFDKAMFEYMLNWSKKTWSSLVKSFVRKLIDTTNVSTWLRMSKEERETISELVFINGGGVIESSSFMQDDDKVEKVILEIVKDVKSFEKIKTDGDYKLLDKISNDVITEFMRETKYESEGPEAIIGYWWAREKSSEVIRSVLVWKINWIDNEEIRKSTKNLLY